MNPKHKQAIRQATKDLESAMRAMGCSTAIMMMERGGSAAVIVNGTAHALDSRRLRATIELFKQRLDEIAEHADGEVFDHSKAEEVFLRESDDGKFEPQEDFFEDDP